MTATLFALLLQVCGLSQREAAAFLDVRPDTVASWSTGRRDAPAGVLAQLADLADRIDAAADEAVDEIERHPADVVQIGLASDDAEAQSIGWPCVGAHRAVIALTSARAMAEGHRVEIVPRGSTVATAAAADVHERG